MKSTSMGAFGSHEHVASSLWSQKGLGSGTSTSAQLEYISYSQSE